MLKGFEKLTEELTDQELQIVPDVVRGIGARKGKENAVKSSVICEKMGIIGVNQIRKRLNTVTRNTFHLKILFQALDRTCLLTKNKKARELPIRQFGAI